MDDDISSSTESDVSEKHVADRAVDTGRGNSVSLDTGSVLVHTFNRLY